MASEERLDTWMSAVERSQYAAQGLKAAIKLFDSGGPDAQAAWDSVEKAREAYVACNKREAICWRKVTALPDQVEMPAVDQTGPTGVVAPRALPQEPMALPPHEGAGT